jgi:hypothetical protein
MMHFSVDVTEGLDVMGRIYAAGALYAAVDYFHDGEGARHGWTFVSFIKTTALWPWNLYNRFTLQ